MKLTTFYYNYVPEILIIIFTYFISIKNNYTTLLFLITLFTFLLIMSIVPDENEDSNTKSDCERICLIFIRALFLIIYLLELFFICLGKKGRINFFHNFSGFISIVYLYIVFTNNEEKKVVDYFMIAFYIINLCYVIITPIFIEIINANYIEDLNINDKIINDSNVNYSSFIDNQINNKDFNKNSDNNINYINNNNENKNDNNNNEININYIETNSNSFDYNMNNSLIADIQNLKYNDDLPTQ